MLFQLFDIGRPLAYYDGMLHDNLNDNLTKTWEYSLFLRDLDIEYANLYSCSTLSKACPSYYKKEWDLIEKEFKAQLTALHSAGIQLSSEDNVYDLMPNNFLIKLANGKNEITSYVLENYEKPKNYDFLVDLSRFVLLVKSQPLNIETKNFDLSDSNVRNILKKYKNCKQYVNYNIFGTVTGRLTTKPGYFPILNFDKKFRKCLKPNNDYFVELDFNAAEPRVILALSGSEQPEGDLYEWFGHKIKCEDRKETKQNIISWLYNHNKEWPLLEKYFQRTKVVNKYWDGRQILTPMGRKIEFLVDESKVLSYIAQSTTSDMLLKQAIKLQKLLSFRKSYVSFSVHDSVVLDMDSQDSSILKKLVEEFSNTCFGKFNVNVGIGENYGDIRTS